MDDLMSFAIDVKLEYQLLQSMIKANDPDVIDQLKKVSTLFDQLTSYGYEPAWANEFIELKTNLS